MTPLIEEAFQRGNIRLRKDEARLYERVKTFVRDNPGCTAEEANRALKVHKSAFLIRYGVAVGDLVRLDDHRVAVA